MNVYKTLENSRLLAFTNVNQRKTQAQPPSDVERLGMMGVSEAGTPKAIIVIRAHQGDGFQSRVHAQLAHEVLQMRPGVLGDIFRCSARARRFVPSARQASTSRSRGVSAEATRPPLSSSGLDPVLETAELALSH